MAENAPNDLLFVPYEAYYNVVLGNHNIKGLAYLTSVKNGFKIGKRVKKRAKKGPFSDKSSRLAIFNEIFMVLGDLQQIFITFPSKYIHRATNRDII